VSNIKQFKPKQNFESIPTALRQIADKISHAHNGGNDPHPSHTAIVIVIGDDFDTYEYYRLGKDIPVPVEVGFLTTIAHSASLSMDETDGAE
jgi:hypothetical protein